MTGSPKQPTLGPGGESDAASGHHARGHRAGKVRVGVLLWALGVPIPIILILLLIRSCM